MSQFNAHQKRSLWDKIMTFFYRRRAGRVGINVRFDSIVHLMRYPELIELSDDVYIKSGARLCPCNTEARITIGKRTTIGYNTLIFASEAIEIGADCMIAPNVYFVDSNHGIDRSLRMNIQANTTAPIKVEDDVWIGTGTVVLKGSFIAQGCVIAANSVIRGSLEPFSIYAGSPAKKVGTR